VNLLVTILMSGLGPVVVPPDRLPRAMLIRDSALFVRA
jgi:hypothetical protein